jgi:FAD:protein FMN transferase
MNVKKVTSIIVIAIALTGAISVSCMRTHKRTELKMGTFIEIRLTGFFWNDFDLAFDNVFAAIDRIEKAANIYDADSELSRLNKASFDEEFYLSEDMFLLLYYSKILYIQTDGIFDITAGPLTMLWKSHIKKGTVPGIDTIKESLRPVGSDKIYLDDFSCAVRFLEKGMQIDLSAIAKGYAVDKAIDQIRRLGFRSAIINAGGDMFCLGGRAFILPWRIGIRDPNNKDRVVKIMNIYNKAIATSGGYEQFSRDEKRYNSHLINPKTGYPVDNAFSSVTVIADKCFMADAIATAVSVGGKAINNRIQALYPEIDIFIAE